MQTETTCPYCGGTGKIINSKCPDCGGKGYKRVKKDKEINIPAGIQSGQQIRVQGMGERGSNGGPNGDLYIEVIVAEHSFFKREGNDIHVVVPLDFIDAVLGNTITVPTVYGDINLKVPAGTQPNQVFRLKDKGVKNLRGNDYGDEYVHIDLKIPTKLNKNQKQALEAYKAATSSDDSFFSKFSKGFKK